MTTSNTKQKRVRPIDRTGREPVNVDFGGLTLDRTHDFLAFARKLRQIYLSKMSWEMAEWAIEKAIENLPRSASGRRSTAEVKMVREEMRKRLAKQLSAKERTHFVRDVIDWADKELNFYIGTMKVGELWDELEPIAPIRFEKGVRPSTRIK